MFYKKFAAVVLSVVLVGVVPSVVFADVDDVSAVSDGDVEELSIEDDFSDDADSISAFASALADKTVSEVQGYQEAKAEAEVIAQERLEAEAAAEAARKAEEERKAAEEARLEKRQGIVDFALQFVGNPYVYGGTSLTNGADCSGFVMSVFAECLDWSRYTLHARADLSSWHRRKRQMPLWKHYANARIPQMQRLSEKLLPMSRAES